MAILHDQLGLYIYKYIYKHLILPANKSFCFRRLFPRRHTLLTAQRHFPLLCHSSSWGPQEVFDSNLPSSVCVGVILSPPPGWTLFGFSFSALLLLVTLGGRDRKTPFLLCACGRPGSTPSTLLPPERLARCSGTYRLHGTTVQSSSPPGHSCPLALPADSLAAADFLPPVARTSLSSLARRASVVTPH